MVAYKGLSGEHITQALQNDLVAGRDPRTGGYIDNDYMDWLRRTSPELFQDPDPTDDKKWKPKPGTDPLTGTPLAKGKEPNPDDAPYRPQKPGGPPWPGYPKPMPPGAPKLAGNPYGLSDDELQLRQTLQDTINDPNTDKDTLREAQKQWLLLPPIELAQGLPPVLGERDAVIQRADALRKAGKIDEALDLYRYAATLPTPTV